MLAPWVLGWPCRCGTLCAQGPCLTEHRPARPAPPAHSIFQQRWRLGEPIVVRGFTGAMGWTPEAMGRVCKEGSK